MNRPYVNLTSILWLFLLVASQFWVEPADAQSPQGYALPRFRDVTALPASPPEIRSGGPVRMIADADFAPFSFTAQNGSPAGLAVELALAACVEINVRCEVRLLPFDALLPALARGEADVILSGLRADAAVLRQALTTRPYFRTMARFMVLSGSPLQSGDARSLAGKRIAVTKDTLHARWLETYYGESEVTAFDTEAAARDALRSGAVEALLGDNLSAIYWIAGAASRNCCRLLDGAFSDFDYFSRNVGFLVRSDRPDLRAALDYGLDAVQIDGNTARVFRTYIPLSPW